MKNLSLLVAGVLMCASANAGKVGDRADYAGTISSGGASYPASLSLEVIGVGSKPDTYLVKTTVSVAGQSQSSTAERTANEVGDESQAAQVVANCAAVKGTEEKITITSGETLQTCKVSGMQDGAMMTVNYAAVPFLTARMVSTKSNQTSTLTLQAYVRGN